MALPKTLRSQADDLVERNRSRSSTGTREARASVVCSVPARQPSASERRPTRWRRKHASTIRPRSAAWCDAGVGRGGRQAAGEPALAPATYDRCVGMLARRGVGAPHHSAPLVPGDSALGLGAGCFASATSAARRRSPRARAITRPRRPRRRVSGRPAAAGDPVGEHLDCIRAAEEQVRGSSTGSTFSGSSPATSAPSSACTTPSSQWTRGAFTASPTSIPCPSTLRRPA